MNAALRQSWTALVVMVITWLWVWFHLSVEWRLNPQYEYGFAVPFLAAMLLLNRLPAAQTAVPSLAEQARGRMLCALSLLPLMGGELIRQADPFWRLGGWLLHFGATLLTFGVLLAWAGRAWVRACFAPVLFLSLAVPWPSWLEGRLTNGLLAVATRVAVDCLNWLGVPSLQRGNVIELSNGLVGIDEACSGIQSLLSSLMASVFLGAYLRLTINRRILLLFAGALTAVLGNVVRIVLLTKAVQRHGQAGFEQAHDPVGMWASAGIFLTLGLIAWLLRPRQPEPGTSKTVFPKVPLRYGMPLLSVVVAIPLLAALTWRTIAGADRDVLDQPHWRVRVKPPPPGWGVRADAFSPEEQRLLQFTQGGAWHFQKDFLLDAYVVHLFWSAERTIPSQAFGHSAQICLPSAGWKSLGDPAPLEVMVGTNRIAGTLGYFEQDASRQAVFQSTWRGSSLRPAATQLTSSRWSRLSNLKEAYRQRGHEMLTVYLPADLTARDPAAVFSAFLNVALIPNTNNLPAALR